MSGAVPKQGASDARTTLSVDGNYRNEDKGNRQASKGARRAKNDPCASDARRAAELEEKLKKSEANEAKAIMVAGKLLIEHETDEENWSMHQTRHARAATIAASSRPAPCSSTKVEKRAAPDAEKACKKVKLEL